MIKVLDAPPDFRELAAIGPRPVRTVPQTAAALPPSIISRYAKQLEAIGARWGVDAASSLVASFAPASESETFLIRVREFGPLAWVEAAEGMMRPLLFAAWFSFDGAWACLAAREGLQRLIRDSAEAVLVGRPQLALDAVRAAVPELTITGVARLDAGSRAVAIDEARYHGCIGPASLSVDTGTFTIRTERTEPWKLQYLE